MEKYEERKFFQVEKKKNMHTNTNQRRSEEI
jgi:hypothetical protein